MKLKHFCFFDGPGFYARHDKLGAFIAMMLGSFLDCISYFHRYHFPTQSAYKLKGNKFWAVPKVLHFVVINRPCKCSHLYLIIYLNVDILDICYTSLILANTDEDISCLNFVPTVNVKSTVTSKHY